MNSVIGAAIRLRFDMCSTYLTPHCDLGHQEWGIYNRKHARVNTENCTLGDVTDRAWPGDIRRRQSQIGPNSLCVDKARERWRRDIGNREALRCGLPKSRPQFAAQEG